MSYQSPIDVCYQDINAFASRQVEDGIMQVVQRVGFHVDREELERALLYDRGQYEKGFRDGVDSVMQDRKSADELFREAGCRRVDYFSYPCYETRDGYLISVDPDGVDKSKPSGQGDSFGSLTAAEARAAVRLLEEMEERNEEEVRGNDQQRSTENPEGRHRQSIKM